MQKLGNFDSLKTEEDILQWWDKEKIYDLVKKAEPKDKRFFFLDGPPYTTGDVHLGTAWNKILKDSVIKYKRMQGYRVTDTPGYDTHGLPIEVVIEKKLKSEGKLTEESKQGILNFGLDNFIQECRNFAESKIGDMNEQFKRLGCVFWNWENPYITLKNTYIEGIWWTLKKAFEKGYLYKFFKPQNCCPRCATALAKHEFEYENIRDNAIYVKFQSVEDPKTFYVIWTTTPWTLVSNTNIMINPDFEYVKMRVKDEYWIMGIASTSDLLQNKLGLALNAEDGFSYGERYTGYDLEGKRYIHPLAKEVPAQTELEKEESKVHTILLSREYVQETGGSGMVHTAPGHGPEDFEVGVENGIPIFNPVDIEGKYTAEAGQFEGKFVHTTNDEIIALLEKKGTLVHKEKIEHEYAHCWRCKSKLVYRATEQWFFKTSALKEEMLSENDQIYWVPEYAGKNSFRSWLSNLQDWCISRQRYWGIPLSIWTCDNEECDNVDVIGSSKELAEKAGNAPEDLHKPWIDQVTWKCSKCGGTMTRIPDVLDVWLDSGSVMWASQKFVDGHEHFDTWEPADFILEGKDQIRGWFNSLLCSSMVSSQRRNYNACYMHGWVNSHGIKMSKSLGNSITPQDIIEGRVEILTEKEKEDLRKQAALERTSKFDKTTETKKSKKPARKQKYIKDDKRWSNVKGIETFRFFSIMGTPAGKDLNFDYKEYTDAFKVLNTFWNSYIYAQEKMELNEFNPATKFNYDALTPADRWMVSRTNTLVKDVTDLFEKYLLYQIPARLQEYILYDLSRWYITLIRDRVDPSNEDESKANTLGVLYYSLEKLMILMAPITPMLTEELYQKMFKPNIKNAKKSIHLLSWPKVEEKYIDEGLEKEMELTRLIIEEVRSVKTENKIKLRWPTKGLYIIPDDVKEFQFQTLIEEMSNVKEFKLIKKEMKGEHILSANVGKAKIFLDVDDSIELQQERIVKDLMRTLQTLRKQANLQIGEEITLNLASDNAFLKAALESFKTTIESKVGANPLSISENPEKMKDATEYTFNVCMNEGCYAMIREKHAEKVLAGKGFTCSYCDNEVSTEKMAAIQVAFVPNK